MKRFLIILLLVSFGKSQKNDNQNAELNEKNIKNLNEDYEMQPMNEYNTEDKMSKNVNLKINPRYRRSVHKNSPQSYEIDEEEMKKINDQLSRLYKGQQNLPNKQPSRRVSSKSSTKENNSFEKLLQQNEIDDEEMKIINYQMNRLLSMLDKGHQKLSVIQPLIQASSISSTEENDSYEKLLQSYEVDDEEMKKINDEINSLFSMLNNQLQKLPCNQSIRQALSKSLSKENYDNYSENENEPIYKRFNIKKKKRRMKPTLFKKRMLRKRNHKKQQPINIKIRVPENENLHVSSPKLIKLSYGNSVARKTNFFDDFSKLSQKIIDSSEEILLSLVSSEESELEFLQQSDKLKCFTTNTIVICAAPLI